MPAVTEPTSRRPRQPKYDLKWVASLEVRDAPYFEPDPKGPGGSGIRVFPSGARSYVLIQRDAFKRQRWVSLGPTNKFSDIEVARAQARDMIKRLQQGLEPREPPPPEPPKPKSLAKVVADWLELHVEGNKLRSGRELKRVLHNYVLKLPAWRDKDFEKIKRTEITGLLDSIQKAHGKWVADSVLAALRQVSNWYVERSDDYVSPFTGIKRRVKDRKRTHALSDDDIRAIWHTAEAIGGPYGALVRLLMLTGQRREAVATMRWSDISDDVWTVRSGPRRKGTGGRLKLPPPALAIINAMPRFATSDLVFAGTRYHAAFSNFSRLKLDFDRRCGVTGWVLHDLRRVARSLMSRAGVPREHAEKVLGHVVRGVEGHYDLHSYESEKAIALQRLAAVLDSIVNPPPEGDNVVAFPGAAS
jgi:integrase